MMLAVVGLVLLVIGLALWVAVTPAGFWLFVIGIVAAIAGLIIDRQPRP